MRRVLLVTYSCYLDSSNGASIASRAMMEALARQGFVAEALSGLTFEHGGGIDANTWLAGLGISFETAGGDAWTVDARGLHSEEPIHYRLNIRDVSVTLAPRAGTKGSEPRESECTDFLRLYDAIWKRLEPEILVNYGSSRLMREVRSRARSRGTVVVFPLHNCNYDDPGPFATADTVIVPSQFAAYHYRKTLGLDCTVLSNLVDWSRIRAETRDPRYLTFVNPSYEKGVYAFARIADELGRRRPDIPLLVVESRGSERTLVDCGIDLRPHGTVHLMAHTDDPRHFWSVTRVCVMPSLAEETQGLTAVEAMANGIPVIASDRGALPETLGVEGILLPLPERLTPAARSLPDPEEAAPWVEAVARLWDEGAFYAEHQERAIAESRRWAPEILEPQYARFFEEVPLRQRTNRMVSSI
jgi:glycosyltransferase involved in cell wall biosynthesis